ncbi:hypothetical protein F384_01385 [Citrobacter amalonaticus Y19]|uniref:Uncharacterized protein n=1 Tax=Citrobacter amalonaticus Y19 TaxID=1261127 RepID=A0A0F6TSV1_CITAM|nr:hypothetical protein F384_01385 [Citrobacter amalonaticus Y19]
MNIIHKSQSVKKMTERYGATIFVLLVIIFKGKALFINELMRNNLHAFNVNHYPLRSNIKSTKLDIYRVFILKS